MDLLQLFRENWTKKKFVALAQPVLLAVSGGMDSMVMADLFLKSKLPFGIAHCNFQLRDKESDLDEQLVQQWAIENNIPFYSVRFETKKHSEAWKKGTQETARILRYEWLDTIRKDNGYARLVTAHHANDNVETLLMNLFKGTGITGLHGIPEQNGHIIRPLLFALKEQLINYAQDNNVPFREDASNATDAYLRNAVRHHLIPLADKLFPGAVHQVNESIGRFAQAEILYRQAIEQERKKLLEKRGQDFYIPILKLQQRQPLETICYELFTPFGFTAAQVPHILQLLSSESGHFVLSNTHRIIRNRNFLVVTAIPTMEADLVVIENTDNIITTDKYQFSLSIEAKPTSLSSDPAIAYLDMKYIAFPLLLRKWRLGDYFYPLGMNMKKKKISRFLIDQKVALHDKEQIWLFESGGRVAWIGGMRLDERFKVKPATEQVLVIKQMPKN